MRETVWTDKVRDLLNEEDLGEEIYVDTAVGIPYSNKILYFDHKEDFTNPVSINDRFETDLLVYEKKDGKIIPRVVVESKINRITTHDAIVYSEKARLHKSLFPYVRYGVMIGNITTTKNNEYSLPPRLLNHGDNFDFMIAFPDYILNDMEREKFIELLKLEIEYSRKIEEYIFNNRRSDRKKYYLMQKKLRLEEINID